MSIVCDTDPAKAGPRDSWHSRLGGAEAFSDADGDAGFVRAAAALTRNLNRPLPAIFWGDLLLSVAIGWIALNGAIGLESLALRVACGLVAVLALYRAESFIHELTHLKTSALPGFHLVWNLLVGMPLLVPSFLYEGVHNLHHARTRYGTTEDPEYLPLARSGRVSVILFLLASLLGPITLLFRFALLAPLSVLNPALREIVTARASALTINPAFRRAAPTGAAKRVWLWQEAMTSLWSMACLGGLLVGLISPRAIITWLSVLTAISLLNQVRTLVSHLWESDGAQMSVTAQYLDSINVPPPALLPCLWAPVGLRYHALHHLLPGVPYHNLAAAHRRLAQSELSTEVLGRPDYSGAAGLISRLLSTGCPDATGP